MKLFNRKKEDTIRHIAGIVLKHKEGTGYVLKVNETKQTVDILAETSFSFSNGWDNLVYDIDELLFNFENTHQIEINESSFFMYSHFTDQNTGSLKMDIMEYLKTIIKENKLKPLGYIEVDEVLGKAYSDLENSPLNAVIVEIDSPAVSAFVYQGGQKTFAQSVAKTDDIVSDLEKIFKEAPKGLMLPPRVIMYDSSDLESETHSILTHKWSDKMFVQLPRVEVVREHEFKHAIVIGVKQELFGESGGGFMMPPVQKTDEELMPESDDTTKTEITENEKETKEADPSIEEHDEEDNKDDVEDESSTDADNMGFVIGEDVAESPTSEPAVQKTSHDDAEFIRNENSFEPNYNQSYNEIENDYSSSSDSMSSDARVPLITQLINMIKTPSFSGGMGGDSKKRLVAMGLIVASLILIIGAGYATLFYFHKAELIILYDSENLEEEVTVSDELTFEEFTETFTVNASIPTTGEDDVGEKATGKVTLYNADESEKTFEKGTKLENNDGLVFILDSSVTVDGATSEITEDGDILTSTSKAEVSITAEEIGPKYNIKDDTKLTVDGFSDKTYFARTEGALSGGTAKTVQTASRDDFDTVDAQIDDAIDEESKTKLAEVVKKGNIIEDLTTIEKTKETYSAEIAEETDTLDAEVTADVLFYSFDEDKLKSLLMKEFESEISENYELKSENISYKIVDAERDEDSEEITIKVEAEATPVLKLDNANVISDVKGTSLNAIRSILQNKYNAKGYEAKVESPLPFLKTRLPYFDKNITIQLEPVK